jgi:hypothetical protein
MKRGLLIVAIAALLLGLGAHVITAQGNQTDDGSRVLFLNPLDTTLASVELVNGTKVVLFGKKQANGLATAFTGLRYSTNFTQSPPGGGNNTNTNSTVGGVTGEFIALFNSTGFLNQMNTADGGALFLEWQNSTAAVVRVRGAEGNESITNILISSSGAVEAEPVFGDPPRLPFIKPFAVGGSTTARITVQRCGNQPITDPNLVVGLQYEFTANGSKRTGILTGNFTGNGSTYEVKVPTGPAANTTSVEPVCISTSTVIEKACAVVGGISQTICDNLLLEGPRLTCLDAIKTAKAACNLWLGTDLVGTKPTQNRSKEICAKVKQTVDFTAANITLQPIAYLNVTVEGKAETAPQTGPFGPFVLSAGSNNSILSVTTVPVYPAAGENYNAIAAIECPKNGDQVTMTIVGSDTYTNTIICTIGVDASINNGIANCVLTVPGAEAGVRDVITVTLGSGEQKSTSIVFT